MTRTMSDEDLHEILRAADPLFGEPQRPTAETETSLQRVLARGSGMTGELSPRARLGRPVTRWWAVRFAPLAAAIATAVAVISALPSGGPVTVPAASAKVILARAAAAVAGSDGAILHADISATQTWRNGRSDNWTEQDWQQVNSPYDDRSIVSGVWPAAIEMAVVKGEVWLYDASTNTIYTGQPAPAFTLTPGPRPGTYSAHSGSGSSGASLTVSASQATALRDGKDVLATDGQRLVITPRPTTGPKILPDFRSQALSLLHSPTATVTRNVTVDGQRALQVTSPGGSRTYDLDPRTYAPIQMTDTIGPGTDLGVPDNDSTVTLRFTDWRYLTGAAAEPGLLSLTVQHPHATIDSSAADFNAALTRLLP